MPRRPAPLGANAAGPPGRGAAPLEQVSSDALLALLPGTIDAIDENHEPPRSRSLFGEILDWMLAPLLLLWPMSIAVTYLVAKSIANAPFDRALETDAYVLARQLQPVNGVVALTLPSSAREFLRVDNLFYQVLGQRGELIGGDRELPLPPVVDEDNAEPGIVGFRDDIVRGADIRVAYIYVDVPGALPSSPGTTTAAGKRRLALVQIAETLDRRNQLANDIIKGVILPQFVILPLAIILVWFGLSRGLAPLHALQAGIRARRPDDLSPLEARQAPTEIEPLVTSFNELLIRLEENVALQKRFIADAAHQMKTPLAGLRTQAELALRQDASPEVRRSLQQIAASSEQAARLVTQLLALARAENRIAGPGLAPLDITALARATVRDWVQPALAKAMDLGFEEPPEPLAIDGNPLMLREMLGNLLDNAIRYTPWGGRITVRIRAGNASELTSLVTPVSSATVVPGADPAPLVHLEVEDTGPGIPVAERARVLERFYRILGRDGDGSGLGLAIVREIVNMHGGTVTILDHVYSSGEPQSSPQVGTLVRVSLLRVPGRI